MATRLSDVTALVTRLRRVGWPTARMGDGTYIVTCPDDFKVQIHRTPSDVNHLKVVMRLLNKHGFADAELASLDADEEQRRVRLAADRHGNTRRTRELAALTRAAGPYAAVQPTLGEILGEHTSPRVWLQVYVTPDMSRAMLERNTHNRADSSSEQAEWAQKLRAGRVLHTHQGIAFDILGRLIDGQTRLYTIAETGVGADLMVSVGWPVENFAVADSGRRRTAGQILGIAGVKYGAATAAAIRILYLVGVEDDGVPGIWGATALDHTKDRVSNDIVAEVHAKLDDVRLVNAVTWSNRLRREQIKCSLGGTTAGFYLIARKMPLGDERVKGFVEALIGGARRPAGDPVAALRRQLIGAIGNRKMTSGHITALIVKGWNAHITGSTADTMMLRKGSKMPAVTVPATD